MKKRTHKKIGGIHWALVLVFLAGATVLVDMNALDFQASVIPTKQAPAYDGLALPILHAPNWSKLTSEQYRLSYSQMPQDKLLPLPKYDASVLRTPTEQLSWSKAADLNIRNAKITFSTPYMGNYKLDGNENAGSHCAVDIKVPEGTPIYSIGNGVATKVGFQSSGFGNHVVIKHENFPAMDNASLRVTYYSSYSHMSSVTISEGDVVLKGQLIGYVGRTGNASTSHLHFQIDNDQAPWHPYWPFNYQEQVAAGLDFTGAINNGLGREKGLATTINPMVYVQKYLAMGTLPVTTTSTVNTSSPTTVTTTPVVTVPAVTTTSTPATTTTPAATSTPAATQSATSTQITTTPVATAVSTPATTTSAKSTATTFTMDAGDVFVVGTPKTITVKAVDANGAWVTSYKPKDGIYISVDLGGAKIDQQYFSAEQVVNGTISIKVTPTADLGLRIKATDGTITATTNIMKASSFSDVSVDDINYKAINFLKNHSVVDGYPDKTFKPDMVVSRVEALKFILKGGNQKIQETARLPFKDTSSKAWYADYLGTAYSQNIVSGYDDKTFKPSQSVNRAEFLKMLYNTMDIPLPNEVSEDVFSDVKKDDWYAPLFLAAKKSNLIDKNAVYIHPEQGMKRDEVAELIYRFIVLKLTGQTEYNANIYVSDSQVQSYFAGSNG